MAFGNLLIQPKQWIKLVHKIVFPPDSFDLTLLQCHAPADKDKNKDDLSSTCVVRILLQMSNGRRASFYTLPVQGLLSN